MSNEMPVFDIQEELKVLFRQTADHNLQTEIETVLERRMSIENDERFTCVSDTTLRATSPHVLSIHNYFDRNIQIEDHDFDLIRVQVVPTTREHSMYLFNVGFDILTWTVDGQGVLREETAKDILDRLQTGQAYSDHGDLPGWLTIARVDEEGSMVLNVSNENSRYTNSDKLSALFREKATEHGPSVAHNAMTGLWALGLALKIQQKAKEDGTVYEMRRRGRDYLQTADAESYAQMLLKLDV